MHRVPPFLTSNLRRTIRRSSIPSKAIRTRFGIQSPPPAPVCVIHIRLHYFRYNSTSDTPTHSCNSRSMEHRASRPSDASLSLHKSWEQMLKHLEVCLMNTRNIPGCEGTTITIAITNEMATDVYSFPDKDIEGIPKFPIVQCRENNAFELDSPTSQQRLLDPLDRNEVTLQTTKTFQDRSLSRVELFKKLEKLSARQLKKLLSAVKSELGLKIFIWPEDAVAAFKTIHPATKPTAPGRPGATKIVMVDLLRLSAMKSVQWSDAVRKQLRFFQDDVTRHAFRSIDRHISSKLSTHDIPRNEPEGNSSPRPTDDIPVPPNESSTSIPNGKELLQVAKLLPKGLPEVLTAKETWPALQVLLRTIHHPIGQISNQWVRQIIPGDGNCLFYSVMVASASAGILSNDLETVVNLRKKTSYFLRQLADAGRSGSRIRREWLVSCLYDVEDESFSVPCHTLVRRALETRHKNDIEIALEPLRTYVRNRANMVENRSWGGHLTAELNILACITNTTIELMSKRNANDFSGRGKESTIYDLRENGNTATFLTTALHVPITDTLPSWENQCFQIYPEGETCRGWFEDYRVLKLTLNDSHYDAITTRYAFPIAPQHDNKDSSSMYSKTRRCALTEPYSSLNAPEHAQHRHINEMIAKWRSAVAVSVESGDAADSMVNTPGGPIKISDLSRLQVSKPGDDNLSHLMLSDDIVSAYMSLLQERHVDIRKQAQESNDPQPPHTRYMHSWLFNYICRGAKRRGSKRKRETFDDYEQIIVPALLQGHWVLCVCYRDQGIIGVYDPLGTSRQDIFQKMKSWTDLNLREPRSGSWKFQILTETRKQRQIGGIDCGVYICKAAESLGLGVPLTISHADIGYVRERMLLELYMGKATKLGWFGSCS